MGQGGPKDRLAEAFAAARVSGVASQVGCGAHLLLTLSEQADEQGLREAVCYRRGVHLCCDDAPDGKAVGPCLGIFKQSLEGVFSET